MFFADMERKKGNKTKLLQLSVLGRELFQDSHPCLKNLIPVQSSLRLDHPVEEEFGLGSVKWPSWSVIPPSVGNSDRGAYIQKVLSVHLWRHAKASIWQGQNRKRGSASHLTTANMASEVSRKSVTWGAGASGREDRNR